MLRKNSNKTTGIDGVVQRPRRRNLGDFKDVQPVTTDRNSQDEAISINKTLNDPPSREEDPVEVITEQEIIENTRSSVDENKIGKRSWRARRKAKKQARKQKWARRHWSLRYGRRIFKLGVLAAVLIGGYTLLSSWAAINSIIDRGGDGAIALQENIQPSALRGEGDGRINVMLLGIGGEGHVAGNLADSIIVASIDPFANEMAMLSIPRDMYVEIPGFYSSKINAAHALGEENPDETGGGIALMRQTLEETLDIELHYYVRVDFTGFRQAIDTVGGVTINLEEPVYDPNFDWEFGVDALNLPAGENTLDGQTALLLARARGATGIGLGVERGDFGRSDKQRDILLALKSKVLSAGTYSNPVRINELIRNAGNHVRTDVQLGEILRMYEIVNSIPNEKIVSFGLDNGSENYLDSANIGGAAVLLPRDGTYDEIKLFVRELFVDGFIKQEAPVLDVYNGSSVAGLAGETATELESFGYMVEIVDNAPTQNYPTTAIYDLTDGAKPFTKELLQNRFGVTVKPKSELPASLANTTSDYVIILGEDYGNEAATF